MIFLAETYDGAGWTCTEIEAPDLAEARQIAYERFRGTRAAWTLEVSPANEPPSYIEIHNRAAGWREAAE